MRPALLIACALLLGVPGQQAPRFLSGIERVSVDVLVMDGKRPVAGLGATDFELRDSGVPQTVEAVEMNDVPVSLLLALDASTSVRGPLFERLVEGTRAAVDALAPADRVALITFSHTVVLRADWGARTDRLRAALGAVQPGGFTALRDAAFAALTFRDPEPGRRSMILMFSDGDNTMSWLPEQAVLEKANRTDAVVYTVGEEAGGPLERMGRTPNYGADVRLWPTDPRRLREATPFFKELADATGGSTFRPPRGTSLQETFRKIVTDFRSRYVLTYTPEGVTQAGWHPIEVKVKGRRVSVRARRGYSR